MKYFYKALKPGGDGVRGEIDAGNEQEAKSKIRDLGIYPIELSTHQVTPVKETAKGNRGYIDNNLLNDERVLYRAKIHWFILIPGILLIITSLLFLSADVFIMAIIFIIAAIFSLVRAIIWRLTTELAITSRRVIAKFGLIRRSTIELNHTKVESFKVNQSIIGRIVGYGTIFVNGTGGGSTPIPHIERPLEFRRKAMEAIDTSQTE